MTNFIFILCCILGSFTTPSSSQTDSSKEMPTSPLPAASDSSPTLSPMPSSDDSLETSSGFGEFTGSVSYKETFIKMILTLLGLIVLIVFSVFLLKRMATGRMRQMNYGRAIKILERRPLSAKSALYLVEISGKKVVIAESQLEVRTITNIDTLSVEED